MSKRESTFKKYVLFGLLVMFAIFTVPYLANAYTFSIDNREYWPLWPEPSTTTNVFEPPSFQSIGQDYSAWVVFEKPVNGTYNYSGSFWKATLNVRALVEEDGVFKYFPIVTDVNEQISSLEYFVNAHTFTTFPESKNESIQGIFRKYSVIKGYYGPAESGNVWLTVYSDTNDVIGEYANQDFGDWFNYSRWKTFTKGDGDFVLADSGHAPPLIAWEEDSWVTSFIDLQKESIPAGWEDRLFVFLPTNQGILNMYEINKSLNASVDRKWAVVPQPALRQAVYHEAQYVQNDEFSRFTLLDGPVYVRDVQKNGNGEWVRILVGTTGLGTKQINKQSNAWAKENPADTALIDFESDIPSPEEPSSSHNFGIYALDVTDPENPKALWALSNIEYTRTLDDNAEIEPQILSSSDGTIDLASQLEYEKLKYSLTKPLIGFTQPGGSDTREWHLLIVGVNKDNEYCWYDIEPLSGNINSSGTFSHNDTVETVPTKDAGTWSLMELEGDWNYEEIFPTRMLAAYPKDGGLPVLSDVYVYLSNGSFYKWNLDSNEIPERKLRIFSAGTAKNHPAPTLTDFDIAYINYQDNPNAPEPATLLSAVVPVDHVQEKEGVTQDALGLLVIDLDSVTTSEIDLVTINWGGDGEVLQKITGGVEGVAGIALEHKNEKEKFLSLIGSPIFIDNYLISAVYSPDAVISWLYMVNFKEVSIIENSPEKIKEYIDEFDVQLSSMVIDSEGYLHVFDTSGNHPDGFEPISVLSYGDDEGPGNEDTDPSPVKVISWRTRTTQ
ncbi:hypothetical protein [Vibrio sp.]|uniref:hypothetical protein n=1 Tax=Vibrio sp. TaxID=678 RepID=UPI003D0FCD7D